ncbi:uncharacterized protein MONOS_1865 [Monocercomonoides exilis]|uniref:uncharacterized protein n=1 Tax=Monocercomonoides exilis TaxID=2049356 RepID=UPI00355977EC|nr:hypothetical protein MONOS_1865 [Monocercomonoides exilis]|eukprot:MONOS_1865.1-p1 / transcript=MONOS_1865.1 / gene=MONOS_1865 / organism=Monocercomonoides_exilis_PA203 / gene_product=unspecified product / transcript_product=unspecified product / location=Mono_scaffold00035:80418-84553(+) / protein_length=1257 / sequence_SO=supercontig / SO=protein_coding / is_pseudo=false
MLQSSQFATFPGLTPSTEAAGLPGGAQSQMNVQSQPQLLSPPFISQPTGFSTQPSDKEKSRREEEEDMYEAAASVFVEVFGQDPVKSLLDIQIPIFSVERIQQEYSLHDFSLLLPPMPPPATISKNWFNDALDNAGYKQETCLCQAFKAVMFCLAEMDSNKESARQRASDALVLTAKAFQEARNTRIQGRFGFKAAEKMRAEAAAGLLTARQEQILKESELETDSASARRRYRSFEAMLEAKKEKRDFYEASPVKAPSIGGAGEAMEAEQKQQDGPVGVGVSKGSNESYGERVAARSDHWRKDGAVLKGMGRDWRRRFDPKWDTSDVEEQKRERETFKDVVQRWSRANKRGAQKSLQGFVGGTDEERNSGGDKSGRCQTQEQRIPNQEEERNLETDLRLSLVECSGSQNAFQMRQRENSGENIAGRSLGSDDRPSSGVLSSPSFRESQTISRFQISRKRLRIQRNAFRIRRCTKNIHTCDEESDEGNKKKMACAVGSLFGRPAHITSRSNAFKKNYGGNCAVFRVAWAASKQGKKPPICQQRVCLPRIQMEHGNDGGSVDGGQKTCIDERSGQMESESSESQEGENKRSRLVHWKTQRNSFRSARRFPMAAFHVSPLTKRIGVARMERTDENQRIYYTADSAMEEDIEITPSTQADSSVCPTGSNDNRCIGGGVGCYAVNQQSTVRRAQSVSTATYETIIELQGANGGVVSSQPFWPSASEERNQSTASEVGQHSGCLQYKQMECRKELETRAEKDMEMEGRNTYRDESHTHPRHQEHKGRRAVKTRESRGLRSASRRSAGDSEDSSEDTNTGCVCGSSQSQVGEMVWHQQSDCRGWSHSSMERRSCFGSPSCAADCINDSESEKGESTSDLTPAELERPELGRSFEIDTTQELGLEAAEGSLTERPFNAMDECQSSSRTVEDRVVESIQRDGEEWWKRALEQKAFSTNLAEECRKGIAETTWRGYLFDFAHFGKQWEECGHKEIPDNIFDWASNCANVFLSLRNGGMSLTCLQITRAAVSFYSSLVFNTCLGDIPLIKMLFRAFRRTNRSKKKENREIWNPQTLLKYFADQGPNETLSFKQLTIKTPGGIRKLAKEALTNAGIPDTFTPNSIKAASISALTMAGIPPVQIAKADLASSMGRVIASSSEGTTKQAQRAEEDKQRGMKERQNNDEKKVAIVRKQFNMRQRNDRNQATDFSQAIKPSKIEEPKEDGREDTEYDKRFIIRTRAQSKKEEIQKEWKVSKAVVMMVSEMPN